MSEPRRAVFLSYASQDAEVARRICDGLRSGGIEVWFDQSELRGGDLWDQKIRRQIRDCGLFIAIISANSDARPEGYFRLEWKLAVDRSQLIADDEPFLLPVVVDGTQDATARVPDKFRQAQWTRLPEGVTSAAFLERVSRLLTREPDTLQPAIGWPTTAAANRRRLTPRVITLLVAAAAAISCGYFALDKFVLSKRTVAAEPAPAAALTAESAPKAVEEKSIAVLPFLDLSENRDQEYFSDGLAEELLDLLAKTPGLHVIARTSSFSFKGKSDDIPTIGKKLNVANILEGSVRKSGSRLRVTTQLIRASSGEHLWSETYDRQLKDVFALQDEIAAAVVAQLKLKLAARQQSATRRTVNVEAYNEYLIGQQFYNRGNIDGWRRAIEAFHEAIALDPNYVAPYEALALAEYQFAGHTGDAAGNQRAQAAAAKAIELGPDDPSGYAARGFIRYVTWDWAGAQADLAKAIELDPGDARFQIAHGDVLGALGRVPEAIVAMRKGVELDPLRPDGWNALTQYLTFMRDFDAARESSRRALEISPDSTFSLNNRGWLQLSEGNARDALATYRKIDEDAFRLCGIAMAEHMLGDSDKSQHALDEVIATGAGDAAYQIAEVYAWRGEKDRAFEWLQRAYAQRDGGLTLIKYDPLLTSVRADARYTELLRKMNLPE
jgi:TolB-like protein